MLPGACVGADRAVGRGGMDRMRLSLPLAALAVLVSGLVSGCGGSDAGEASAEARAAASAQPGDELVAAEDGTAVPEALTSFRCRADGDDVWNASGTVANTTKQPLAYQVTVQVGPATDDAPAKSIALEEVAAESSATFTIAELPTTGTEGPCRVQVLALPVG